jgi:hypothetical protein
MKLGPVEYEAGVLDGDVLVSLYFMNNYNNQQMHITRLKTYFFFNGSTAPWGLGRLIFRGFTITL